MAARSFAGGALPARLLGASPATDAGPRPLELGSTLPGFHVTASTPAERLTLEGRHRYSRYRLDFVVEPAPGGALVRARTSAVFPGVFGRVYRTLVIGTRGHVLVVGRMLRAIARRAERA